MSLPYAQGHILVGIDFSLGSAAALLEARALAESLGAGVTPIHVAEPIARELDQLMQAWLRETGLAESDLVIRRGTPWAEIVRFAGETSASVVVLGSHGRSGFQPLALGSTTSRVLVRSPVPVLVVTSPKLSLAAAGVAKLKQLATGRR